MTDWKEVALGDVAHVSWGDTTKTKAAYVDEGVLAYSASGPDGFLAVADHVGDGVVISAIGAQCGKTWFAHGEWSCIKNTIWFQGCEGVSTRFLYYATANPSLWPRRGAAQPFIGLGDAKAMRLSVPQLADQLQIGSVLGSIDDLIENNRRRIELLEQMAEAIYREWFIRFRYPGHEHATFVDSDLGPIPKGWRRGVLRDIGTVTVGGDWGQDEPGKGLWTEVACLRGVDLPRLQRGDSSGIRVRWIKETSLQRRELSSCDVVVEGSGECGRALAACAPLTKLVGLPLIYSNFCKRLRCETPPQAQFVARFLNSMVSDGKMKAFKTGTAIPNLNFEALTSQCPVVLPPDELLNDFDSVVRPMYEFALTGASSRLGLIRDLLLPKLVTGQIDVSHLDLDAVAERAGV